MAIIELRGNTVWLQTLHLRDDVQDAIRDIKDPRSPDYVVNSARQDLQNIVDTIYHTIDKMPRNTYEEVGDINAFYWPLDEIKYSGIKIENGKIVW